MMTDREKVDHAIKDLTNRGVSALNCAPPAWRMAWGLDLKLPPPHFIRFAHLALLVGACFGFLLTLFLRLWDFCCGVRWACCSRRRRDSARAPGSASAWRSTTRAPQQSSSCRRGSGIPRPDY